MTGLVLMIIGFISFIAGLFVYSSSKTSAEPVARAVESAAPIAESAVALTAGPVEQIPDNDELEKAINMAIVDGVFTPKEQTIIKQIVDNKGLDYDSVIKDIESRISQSGETAETETIDINKKNGYDFEKFIVKKFNKKYFKIKEWAGDKYVEGVYAETTQQPDLILEFELKEQTSEFAVECKWKSNFYKGGVEVANPEQFKRYQNFEAKRNVPVFIAIGIGGKGASPEQLYIVPLKELKSNFVSFKALKKFHKEEDKNFFFAPQTQTLK
ncbi:hypothetical protein [Pontibacter pamirensis]|uniref:hypothetical protein n=1 Tax=Pontibacter pamirensis TaxID=2562824 RepID=UPI001389B20C|nr:hypothetical protein [Pontibacter pamirensis]